MRSLFSTIFILLLASGWAQTVANPVKWEYSYEAISATEGNIIIKASIDDKWHIYSQHLAADGPIPTSFVFNKSDNYTLVDSTMEPEAEKAYSEVFDAEVTSFSKEVSFTQKIKRTNKTAFDLTGSLEFMSCNDNMCLPPKTIEFTISVPAAK